MSDRPAENRLNEFRARPLPWLFLHHLLDVELVRQLLTAIVAESSGGRLSLGDLFEEAPAAGDPATADWILATRDTPSAFGSFLSGIVLAVVWQGDEVPFTRLDGLGAEETDWARGLVTALTLGTIDLSSNTDFEGEGRTTVLKPFAEAMVEARQAVRGKASAQWEKRIDDATSGAPPLLSALFKKHVGDLFGDADRWDLALECYIRAGELLADDGIWEGAIVRARQIIAQSVAMATWHREGPEKAATLLEALVSQSTVNESPLPLLNASFDLINAHIARGSFSTAWPTRRPATYAAPLLLQSHHLDNAMTYAATGRFRDSHRWFWAGLRRQTALGGTIASCQTKAHYGRAVVDEVEASLGRERRPDAFAMGVRLLVESGRTELVEATSWSDRLVETYLTREILEELQATTARNPGTRGERELVATTLRREWLIAIPRDSVDLARRMMADLAASARLGQHTGLSSTNTGGLALKALKTVAMERPEFRVLLGAELVTLVDELRRSAGPLPVAEAIEAAAQFIDGVDAETAEAVCIRVVELVADLPFEAFWPVTQAASQLLGSDAASTLGRRNEAFQRARSVALVKLALNSKSDHASLLYLLRDVDPAVVREQIDTNELKTVVEGIRERARQTSSSAATSNIHALLVAPKIAGEAGVNDALDAIERILRSATAPHPSPSLRNGYEVLLLLAHNGDRISQELSPAFDLRTRSRRLLEPLQDMWRSAAVRPLIFAGFAIPPLSAPNRVTVHNWTFATLELLRWLGHGAELDDALSAAAANGLLAEGMSTGRAVQATDSEVLNAEAVAKERVEAFYAALGERLVAIGSREDPSAAASLRMLLDRCLHLGPRGEDAALLLASRRLGITLDPQNELVNTYTAKLRRDVKLRLSLSPLLRSVLDQAAACS